MTPLYHSCFFDCHSRAGKNPDQLHRSVHRKVTLSAWIGVGKMVVAGLLLLVWGCANSPNEEADELAFAHRRITKIVSGPDGTTCFLKWGGTITCTAADWLKTNELPWLAHDIAVSDKAVCTIKRNPVNPTSLRSVSCTGSSKIAQEGNRRPSAKRYTQIEGGWDFFCTLQEDGTLRCWCEENICPFDSLTKEGVFSFLGVKMITSKKFKHISASGLTLCLIGNKNGNISCIMSREKVIPTSGNLRPLFSHYGQWIVRNVPQDGGYEEISVSGTHACARGKEGLFCWGNAEDDQQLKEMMEQVNREARGIQYTAVVTGPKSTCAKEKSSGRVRCWGAKANVQPPLHIIPLMTE